jgi:hypothetical protein
MHAFTDPRTDPSPAEGTRPGRKARHDRELDDLLRLCREGRLYDVERWIGEGRPLQLWGERSVRRGRVRSALEIALEGGNHALILLLLCNGYDPNVEPTCPLDLALRSRRWDLLDLLLEWGADPREVDLQTLFDTYRSNLWERFRAMGVDLAGGHALGYTLAYHTSNKPAFGFAKRYREHDPKIQGELNIALAHHAEEGNEKGVQLCLWAGADAHAPARSLRDGDRSEEDDGEGEGERFEGFNAIWRACLRGHAEILKRLGPDPLRDDFGDLYSVAGSSAVVELLARCEPPKKIGELIRSHLWRLALRPEWSGWGSMDTLRKLFEVGGRWTDGSADEIAGVRRLLLKTADRTFVDLMKLLALHDYCSPEVLRELARTPSMRARMEKVGFIPRSPEHARRFDEQPPTRSREVLAKCGVAVPRPTFPLPRSVQIGTWRRNGREIRLDRTSLFDHVWTTPVAKLAEEWGLSGPGLAKACRRLQIPVPPRGFWARLAAGERVRRPRLATLKPGEAEEIVIWAPL